MYNQAPAASASLIVDKQWVINGTTYPEGRQPPGFSATFSVVDANGQLYDDLSWGVVYTGLEAGATGTASEAVVIGHDQCALDSQMVTIANGDPVSEPLPFDGVLEPGLNEFEFTNTVTCETALTLEKVVQEATGSIREGESIADPLRRSGQFPPIVTHMIAVGEKSGALEQMLESVADSYDAQVETNVQALTSLLEPLMIVVMGTAVGFIAFSIMMPLIQMNEFVHSLAGHIPKLGCAPSSWNPVGSTNLKGLLSA